MLSGCATATFYSRGNAENLPLTDNPPPEVKLALVCVLRYSCPLPRLIWLVLMVRAASKSDLFTLTVGPEVPSALTYTLTVLSFVMSLKVALPPPALEVVDANMLTPLNFKLAMS